LLALKATISPSCKICLPQQYAPPPPPPAPPGGRKLLSRTKEKNDKLDNGIDAAAAGQPGLGFGLAGRSHDTRVNGMSKLFHFFPEEI
jgi:hypothetical protein